MRRTRGFAAAVDPGAGWKAWLLAGLLAVITIVTALPGLLGNLPTGPKIAMFAVAFFMMILTLMLGVGSAITVNRISYEIVPQGLRIKLGRWRGPFIRRSEIRGVFRPENVRPHQWSSMAGIRMPGLYVASVNNPTYGQVSLFVTTRDQRLVLVDTDHGRYGLSPDRPEDFIKALDDWGVPVLNDGHRRPIPSPAAARGPGVGPVERRLFLLSAAVLVLAAVWVGARLQVLPARVPVHFNLSGEPDRFGSPLELVGLAWFLLGTNLFGGVGLLWFIARSSDAFTARLLAYLCMATSLVVSIIAVGMTY